ncbi:restriction endonuclease [Desulfofundulus sp. TPOSR]|uniref:restriction endonuclease n=1 Tax=Desulfofundulus sp. TPOSR TaxID=2714340 RepID=UPI00140B972E|nr:restriction endonuclease [Desulfofundulus sp. TPOSR]NHM28386.1 restriction endonuclease [Desulfofundulus sp. TPOSR]QSS05779.1 restriction endonuclease [Klebsiella pneumoniae]
MKVFKFPRRALYLAYRSWQKRRQRGELLRYYVKPKEDSRNCIARWLDFYGTLLILWLLSFMFLTTFWPGKIALCFSLALVSSTGLLAAKIQKKRFQTETIYRRIRSLAEKYREKLKHFRTAEELASFLWPILESLPQFEQARPKGRKRDKTAKVPAGVIQATYRNVPVLVEFIPADQSPVDVSAVHNLVRTMKKQGYQYALLVTPGEFAPSTRRLVASLRSQYRIALVPEKELLYLVAQAEKIKESTDQITAEKTISLPSLSAFKRVALDYKKGRAYLTAGALLTGFHFLLGINNPVGKAYLFLAAVNLVLAVFCLVFGERETAPPDLHDLQPEI